MISVFISPWMGWCAFIIMLGAIGKSCIDDYKRRKSGESGVIPFWTSLPDIFIAAILCVFCLKAGVPYQLVILLAVVYCLYVFYAARKANQER